MQVRVVTLVLSAIAVILTFSLSRPGATERVTFREVRPGIVLRFPLDHGAHPEFRNEWWYITGWLKGPEGAPIGFQITFFRSRPGIAEDNPSAFAPRQIVFAHAALSDPALGKLLHQERIYRAGFGLASAATADTDVVIGDWRLNRSDDGQMHAEVGGTDFALQLIFTPTQPPLPEGDGGYSRKGPKPADASYYYSVPHLVVTGHVRRAGHTETVSGSAWLDREWSSSYLDPEAVGWDWAGLNLDDGGAVMAFRIRDRNGRALWAAGTLRDKDGAVHALTPDQVIFAPVRQWRSRQTGTDYPVETMLTLRLPAGDRQWHLAPLFDDQEYDSRATGGPVYWEGAVRANGGSGYLEMTGYFHPLKM